MRSKLLHIVTALFLFIITNSIVGQAPNLGAAASFALFTTTGAFTNVGASTSVSGDVGTNAGVFTAFPPGTLTGQIHVADGVSLQAATDLGAAYGDLSGRTCGIVHVTALGASEVLTPNVYCLGAASTLNGDLILDGQGVASSVFIFKIDGALSTGAFSNVILINSASICNVFWQINGQFDLGDGSVFRGTVVAAGAINLLGTSSLLGRGLTTAGAISLYNNLVTNPLTGAAGTISGTASVCQGTTGVNYSLPAITNATDYIWTLPSGATITAGTNTNSITVNFSASATSGNVTVQGSNSCGPGTISANYPVTVNPAPATTLIYHF